MPQNIFEIGQVFTINQKNENKTQETQALSIALCHTKTNFTEAKQVLDYVMGSLGKLYLLKQTNHDSFISGRAAEIILNKRVIGIIGEVHPKVLGNWKLKTPVAAIELDLGALNL